jgi:hypothetical protein
MLPRTTDLMQFPVSFAAQRNHFETFIEHAESNSPSTSPPVKTITMDFHAICSNDQDEHSRDIALAFYCVIFNIP